MYSLKNKEQQHLIPPWRVTKSTDEDMTSVSSVVALQHDAGKTKKGRKKKKVIKR